MGLGLGLGLGLLGLGLGLEFGAGVEARVRAGAGVRAGGTHHSVLNPAHTRAERPSRRSEAAIPKKDGLLKALCRPPCSS